ncbi:hypothetical protein [Catenulispora acidiphila]|uniref:hypothetical protein n=1 Tax=Catenulispora acidiphila TaxID=304895 RepID=UPI001CBD3E15|nr:hypothetical protein [Catenulispora acidiphila]
MDLTVSTERAVVAALRRHLLACGVPGELIGVSCMARGADSLFAQALIELGGRLEVIIPSVDYRQSQVTPDHEPVFSAMLDRAAAVHQMPAARAAAEAYAEANRLLLASIDELVAVWDGGLDGPVGGTMDVVLTALACGIPVTVIWPEGAERG